MWMPTHVSWALTSYPTWPSWRIVAHSYACYWLNCRLETYAPGLKRVIFMSIMVIFASESL